MQTSYFNMSNKKKTRLKFSKNNSRIDFGSLTLEAVKQHDHEGLKLILAQKEVWEWEYQSFFIMHHELLNKICYSLEDFFDIPHGTMYLH